MVTSGWSRLEKLFCLALPCWDIGLNQMMEGVLLDNLVTLTNPRKTQFHSQSPRFYLASGTSEGSSCSTHLPTHAHLEQSENRRPEVIDSLILLWLLTEPFLSVSENSDDRYSREQHRIMHKLTDLTNQNTLIWTRKVLSFSLARG